MKRRVADYLFQNLANFGVEHVFLVTGGGAMHLNDAIKKEERLTYVCHHHEQACAIAAEGYARASQKLAVVNVTSGPGGTNALTGVLGQWTDSVPTLYISGQVKFETTAASHPENPIRQLGDQEIGIVDIARPITKFAKMITDPSTVKDDLIQAVKFAMSGRPGPTWLDVPLNIQGALFEEDDIDWSQVDFGQANESLQILDKQVEELSQLLAEAKRPLLIAGHGIRIAGGIDQLHSFIDKTKIPVVTTFNGVDLLEQSHPNYVGRIGTLGTRGGNFALQNADLVISLGSRNNIRQVSYNWPSFAKNAKKVVIDIDPAELGKRTLVPDLAICADAKDFLTRFSNMSTDLSFREWLDWCVVRKEKYSSYLTEYDEKSKFKLHPYKFVKKLAEVTPAHTTTVTANGSACVVYFQVGSIKKHQRVFWNSGCASMGYALPASIGAAFATGQTAICVTGEGSIQMNLQELQTIKEYQIPVKVVVLNNNSYKSIEQTQTNFFKADFIGCNNESKVSFPDCEKLANLYDLDFLRCDQNTDLDVELAEFLRRPGPGFIEAVLDNDYIFAPKLSSRRLEDGTMISPSLEDLFPFLDRDELRENMVDEHKDQVKD